MPMPVKRETFIALKARRTAYRVVSDFLHHNKLQRTDVACARCGHALRKQKDGTQLCFRCIAHQKQLEANAAEYNEAFAQGLIRYVRVRRAPKRRRGEVSTKIGIGITLLILFIKLATCGA